MSPKRPYPRQAYNFISLAGVGMALFGLAAIVILFVLNSFSGYKNPYLGIFIFVLFPGVLVLGLLLIPAGMWLERRRMDKGKERPLYIDLGNAHHRNVVVTFIAGTSVFLLLTTLGLYGGYQYTESVQFCGEVCHVVMKPEFTAYQDSPHARVRCVECHIGPGATWFVKSKISGTRQIFKTVLGTYPTPIPTPIENLRPAKEVCEECHWPEKFYGTVGKHINAYLGDEENSHWRYDLLLKVGGTSESPRGHPTGIHWHVDESNAMTYVAEDSSRQSFRMVSWGDGENQVVYTRGGKPIPDEEMAAARDEGLVRILDCVDCHNRPSHIYKAPVVAVNEAMAKGSIDPSIPNIKAEAVRALSTGARDSIALALQEAYPDLDPQARDRAIESVQAVYARNMFPEMKVRWNEYPDNRGHWLFPGCFRCHGSDLETSEGKRISDDCSLCHVILSQGHVGASAETLVVEEGQEFTGLQFHHPVDLGGEEFESPCYDCHTGDDSLY